MRVALNGWFLQEPSTGTGQYLQNLLREFSALAPAADVEIRVISPRKAQRAPALVRLTKKFLRDRGNLAKVEFEHRTFPGVARRIRADVAHVPHFGPPLRSSVPIVVTVHDLIPLIFREYRRSIWARLYTWLAVAGARRARLIIADSEASKRDIVEIMRISPDRVRVIYLAAEPRFRPITDKTEQARVHEKYRLPEKFILYLGGFDVRKNVRTALEAFANLQGERAEGWKLVLAGRLPESNSSFRPDPRDLAKSLSLSESVNVLDYVGEEDKPALYSLARACVFPSLYEGFGLPPLEAMACGTPVIGSNAASLPEVIGDGGTLLAPRDIRAWTEALRALIGDDARYQAQRERGLMQARRFSWQRTARETLDAYQSALQFVK